MYNKIKELINEQGNVQIINRKYNENDLKNYVIDCTGFNRLVIDKFLSNNIFKDARLTNNSALVYREEIICNENHSTFTKFDKIKNSWSWKIPLKNDTSHGYVFNSNITTLEEASKEFANHLGIDTQKFNKIDMIAGRNIKHFYANDDIFLTSIGLSSAFIEPLESTGLYFTCLGLNMLKDVINKDMCRSDFEMIFNQEFDNVTEFILAHFHNNYIVRYSDIFPERSWNYLLKAEASLKKPKINLSTLQTLKEIQ